MIELELVAVAWAVKKCNLFLDGLPHFDIVLDHAPLIPLLNKYTLDQIDNPRLQRLRRQLDRYSFTASWIKGKDNNAADALSRAPTDKPSQKDEVGEDVNHRICVVSSLRSLSSDNSDLLIQQVSDAARSDPEYQALRELLTQGFPSNKTSVPYNLRPFFPVKDRLALDDELIVCGQRLLIPQSLRKDILVKLSHMHQGATKMKQRARLSVYWPNLDRDIDQHCLTCQPCQAALPSHQREPIISQRRPQRAFEELHVDLFEYGGKQFLVCVDGYSGWSCLNFLGQHATTSQIMTTLRQRFMEKSVPSSLFSDNGPQFSSMPMKSFLARWGVTHTTSSPHFPQSNGRAEACVKQMKKMVRGNWDPEKGEPDWDKLSEGLLIYHNTPRYDGLSPAQLLFGRAIRDSIPTHRGSFSPECQALSDDLENRASVDDRIIEKYNARSRRL